MKELVAFAAFALASCNYRSGPLPTETEVARVERMLASVPCIGPTNGWERSYRYHLKPNGFAVSLSKLDRDLIDFKLLRAGRFAQTRSRRQPPYPPIAYEADSTPADIAWGSYDLRSGKLDLQYCGSNSSQ